jgi:hypothetical protein
VQERYEVDDVRFVDELAAELRQAAPPRIYLSHGLNTDSGSASVPAVFEGIKVGPSVYLHSYVKLSCTSRTK